MKIYTGCLYCHFETGYEGSPWAFHDADHVSADGKHWSYDGMYILKSGDILEVHDSNNNHVWTGIVNLKYDGHRDTPLNMDYDEWRDMFSHYPDYYRARLIKGEDWLKQETKDV